jgi:spore coat polysaccharide biosynthesis predicted glycosyltransferase SpsG/RimJ/RimL family protein N-acetyltransferase
VNILFRVDFGVPIGFGHISRSSVLAKAFIDQGHNVSLVTRIPFNGAAANLRWSGLPDGVKVHYLEGSTSRLSGNLASWLGAPWSQDLIETRAIATKYKVDLLVIDHYGIGEEWVGQWKGICPILSIADKASCAGIDYVVDYGFDSESKKHVVAKDFGSELLLGPEFAPVSNAYSVFSSAPDGSRSPKLRVLVSLGGSAPDETWQAVVDQLVRVGSDVDFFLTRNSLERIQTDSGFRNFHEMRSYNGLVNLFTETDFAIVSAGLTMYEMLAAGKSGMCLVLAENQRGAFDAAIDAGIVKGLGIEKFNSDGFERAIGSSIAQNPRLHWLRGRAAVDHLGSNRIVLSMGLMRERKEVLRPFTPLDAPFLLRVANQPSSRRNSFSEELISPTEHIQWLENDAKSMDIFIYELAGVPIGYCRLKRDGQNHCLSYAISQSFQGRGLSERMLSSLLNKIKSPISLLAEVKPGNLASLHVLRKCGFSIHKFDNSKIVLSLDKR